MPIGKVSCCDYGDQQSPDHQYQPSVSPDDCRGGDPGRPRWVGGKYSASRRSSDSARLRPHSIRTFELDAPGRMAVHHRRCTVWFGCLTRLAALRLGTGSCVAGQCIVSDRAACADTVSGFQHLAIDLRHGCRRHGGSGTVGPQGRLVATPAYGRIDLTSLACACLDRALRLVKTSPNCPLFG